MVTRRQFLKYGSLLAAGMAIPTKWTTKYISSTTSKSYLYPKVIPKYRSPLLIPPPMPKTPNSSVPSDVDYYEIAMRQIQEQILPPGFPSTTVFAYGSVSDPATFNAPSYTIEATVGRPVRVKWMNQLVDKDGNYLPHLLPVDPTLHWANPPLPRDTMPDFKSTPGPYKGPVPMVTHVHGAHVSEESDGYSEAWFLPAANDIPTTYASVGTFYDIFRAESLEKYNHPWDRGSAVFQYPNDQSASTMWYHDHTLGMTRLNVYAGPAGFYLLRGGDVDLPSGVLPGPALSDPGATPYEIPIAIQDRSFNSDGSLSYPDSRKDFDDFTGPYFPDSDIAPIWNPEVFGNVMMVNGRTWPGMLAEQRRYRFRLLNGCNARFLILKLVTELPHSHQVSTAVPFWQIGTESGFLPAPVEREELLLAPAERADVVVDFSDLRPGTILFLINEGPDEPFGGGAPGVDFEPADSESTGQVMAFKIIPMNGEDTSIDIAKEGLDLPQIPRLGNETRVRKLSLNEEVSSELEEVGPKAALLGILGKDGKPQALRWEDDITEDPGVGDIEIWELHNFTMDAHPIHIHETQFEVVGRETFSGEKSEPEAWETGRKDTVIAYPDQITRIKALFDIPGLFAWHCHIVEHEDNEMMRPYRVNP